MTPVTKGTPEVEKVEPATDTDAEEEIKKSDKGESDGMGNLLIIGVVILAGAVVVGVKLLGGKKGKPEQSDDSLYDERDENEE